jgi:hypothetical protein
VPLSVQKGTVTASTSNGATSTVNLASGFDLKAVIFWTVGHTANSAVDGNGRFCQGYATSNVSGIQQGYAHWFDLDAAATGTTNAGTSGSTSVIFLLSAATPTTDCDIRVTTFSAEQFILTYTDAPATAIVIHYLALGGSDIEAARVFSWTPTIGEATRDVTINTGFGQPNLLFLASAGGGPDARMALGISKSATERRSSMIAAETPANTIQCAGVQQARALSMTLSNGTALVQTFDLSASGNWPTDGFEYTTAATTEAHLVVGLALKGTFASTIGAANAAATNTTQDLAHGATPAAILTWSIGIVTTAAGTINATDLGGFHMSASDLTNEGGGGFVEKDGGADASAGVHNNTDKALAIYAPVAAGTNPPAARAAADASANGNNLRLTYTTSNAAQAEFNYLILSGTAAPAATIPSLVMAPYRGTR